MCYVSLNFILTETLVQGFNVSEAEVFTKVQSFLKNAEGTLKKVISLFFNWQIKSMMDVKELSSHETLDQLQIHEASDIADCCVWKIFDCRQTCLRISKRLIYHCGQVLHEIHVAWSKFLSAEKGPINFCCVSYQTFWVVRVQVIHVSLYTESIHHLQI